MTATIRKQIQRSRLAYSGGKRLDLYLTKDEHEALDAFRMALNLPSLTDAVKALIDKQIGNVRVLSYGGGAPRWVRIHRTDRDDMAIHNLTMEEVRDLRYALDRLLATVE